MGKYERPKPVRKGRKLRTVLLLIFLLLLLLIGSLLAFLWFKLDLIQFDDEIDYSVYNPTVSATEEFLEPEPTDAESPGNVADVADLEQVETAPPVPTEEVSADSDVINILLIGTDERTNKFSAKARSDSMILISIDRKDNEVKLVSLERGMGVPILEGQHKGKYDWLTHVFAYGGADLLTKTVEHCFKVEVDHYVRVNFNSVRNVVEYLGGLDISLSAEEAKALSTPAKPLKKGTNRLDGVQALAFAQLRSIDSDWQRVGRQRKVILAAVDRLKGSSLKELNKLADEVLPLIQTNFSKLEIAELMLYAPSLLSAEFDQMTIPKHGTYGGMKVMGGRTAYAVDFEENIKILRDFLYED